MVSDGPLWCCWLSMVVNGPRWLNLGEKKIFYIQTAWVSNAKKLTWQKYTSENDSPVFSSTLGEIVLRIFSHRHLHFCWGWTEVSSNLLEDIVLPLSVFEIQLLYFFSSNGILQQKSRKCQIFLAFSCQILTPRIRDSSCCCVTKKTANTLSHG